MARQLPIIAGIALGGAVLAFSAPVPTHLRARVGVEVIEALRAAPEVRVLVSLRPGSGAAPDAARPGAASWEPVEGRVERRLRSAPLLVATITAGDLARLQSAEEVSRVDLDGEVRGAEGPGAIQIGADAVHALGIDGTGITVALLDTGTDIGENPDLDPALAGE